MSSILLYIPVLCDTQKNIQWLYKYIHIQRKTRWKSRYEAAEDIPEFDCQFSMKERWKEKAPGTIFFSNQGKDG